MLLRFELAKSALVKWHQLSKVQQKKLYEQFCKEEPSLRYRQDSAIANPDAAYCWVEVTEDTDISFQRRAMFADFVTSKLSRHRSATGEIQIAAKWACKVADYGYQFELEVPCSVGRIDVVLRKGISTILVEAKFARSWKHALGQVLAYKVSWAASADCALLLIGDRYACEYDYRLIEEVCRCYNVHVIWYNGSEQLINLSLPKQLASGNYDGIETTANRDYQT